MILLGSSLTNAPIVGIQTGTELARTNKPIIDPADLSILGYELEGPLLDVHPSILRIDDVRELSDLGFIVDSSDEFVGVDDVVKLASVYNLHFDLVGMTVQDEKQHKLGKVIDFTLETTTFLIQQLTVKRPLFKSFSDTELIIHRTQIIEINNDAIVVHSEAKAPEPELREVVGSYVNPFRKSKPTAEARENQE